MEHLALGAEREAVVDQLGIAELTIDRSSHNGQQLHAAEDLSDLTSVVSFDVHFAMLDGGRYPEQLPPKAIFDLGKVHSRYIAG